MNQGFWKNLKKPFFVLAPLADVTDPAYRRLIARHGKPDVTWTEFVSADGLVLADRVGKEKLLRDLLFTEAERPIVAQLFTSSPENMEKAARLVADLGFDGVDINMGCPDRSIEKQCAGAAMIKNPEIARAVVDAARKGAPNLPVSVKTRIGYSKLEEFETWMETLLSLNLPALTLHARTRKEMSKVPARWEYVKRLTEMRDSLSPETLVIGNGDVWDWSVARQRVEETNCDGVMFGRAIFGNPWLFDRKKEVTTQKEKIDALIELAELFEKLLPHKNFAIMKKHIKAFINEWDGAKELRAELMETAQSADDFKKILKVVS